MGGTSGQPSIDVVVLVEVDFNIGRDLVPDPPPR